MQIKLQFLSGSQETISIDPATAINDLKEQILAKHPNTHIDEIKLVYKGVMIPDDTTIQAIGIQEGERIVVMIRKVKPNTRPTEETPAPNAEPISNFESNIENLVSMGFDRQAAHQALQAANSNLETAIELLMSEMPPSTQQQNPLEFLRHNPTFIQIKSAIRVNPEILEQLLIQLEAVNFDLAQTIRANPEAFMQLVNEPDLPPTPNFQYIDISRKEMGAIRRLMQLGFGQKDVVEAFLLCERNEHQTANMLFENYIPLAAQGLPQEQLMIDGEEAEDLDSNSEEEVQENQEDQYEQDIYGVAEPAADNYEEDIYGEVQPAADNQEEGIQGEAQPAVDNYEQDINGEAQPVADNYEEDIYGEAAADNYEEDIYGEAPAQIDNPNEVNQGENQISQDSQPQRAERQVAHHENPQVDDVGNSESN